MKRKEYPQDFRERLHNLKVDAQETIVKIMLDWATAQERPDATRILIGERMRYHIQPVSSLTPDACITVAAVNGEGVFDDEDNFFPWDNLGHENDIISVAEYVEGIRLYLMQPNPQLLIENELNKVWGDTNEDRNHNESVAGSILDKLKEAGVKFDL